MPVTVQNSVQHAAALTDATTLFPTELFGVPKIAYFTHDQTGAGDATSSVALCRLPAGRVRVLLPSSVVWCNWTTASATLDLGWDAYVALSDGAAVAASVNGLIDGLNVDTAGYFRFDSAAAAIRLAGGTYLFESRDGVVLRASSTDTAIVSGDDLAGYVMFVTNGN